VFYVSTDQDGNFRVGEYFRIDQATGRATLNANAFDLAGLTSLKLGSIGAQLGETINEFSSDATMSGNSNTAVPTEYAVKTFVEGKQYTKTFAGSGITTNANGLITAGTLGGITYSNVTYALVGGVNRVVSYTETINNVSKSITLTYNSNGSVATIASL